MKRLGIITGTIAAIIVSAASIGCTEEINMQQDPTEGLITREFTASFSELTKTAIEEGGKVSWCEGDTIWYYTENSGKLGYHIVNEDCKITNITVKMQESANFIVAFYGDNGIEYNYSDMLIMKGLAGIHQEGGFGDAHFSIARCEVGESSELVFKNITSMIKFSLSRKDIHYVSITSNDGTPLSHSEYFIDLFDDQPYIFPNSEIGENTIYVHTGGAGTFYIGLLPVILENGFNIECYDKSMRYIGTVRSEKQLILSEREIINLGTLDERIFNQEFRLYHIYGPVPVPPTEPTPPTEDYTPIPPDCPDYQTDREHHIYGDSFGNIVAVYPDKEKGGSIVAIRINETGKTIVAHTDQFGKLEHFISEDMFFEAGYFEDGAAFRYTDTNGKINEIRGLENPYLTEELFSPRDPIRVYSHIVSPVLDLVMAAYTSLPGKYMIAALGYSTGWFASWGVKEYEQKMLLTLATGSIGVGLAIVAGAPWWIAAAVIKTAIDLAYIHHEHLNELKAEQIYLDAVPITLEWEQDKDFSATLYCSIGNRGMNDNYRIGIIVGSTDLLTRGLNDYKKLENVGDENVYSFTFSGLKPNKRYYYSAVLAPLENDDKWHSDCWRYGKIGTFTLSPDYGDEYITAVDLGLSVKWASCNLGATRPEDVGNYYAWAEIEPKEEYTADNYKYYDGTTGIGYKKITKYCTDSKYGKFDYYRTLSLDDDAAYQTLGGNWRVPTTLEWRELYNNCTWYWVTTDDSRYWKAQSKKKGYEDKYILIPLTGTYTSKKPNITKNSIGYYWCNELSSDYYADMIRFDFTNGLWSSTYIRETGLPIRAVLRK